MNNYYDDIEHAFVSVGYYQGNYRDTDSTDKISNYGVNLHYAEEKLSVILNLAWSDDRFFSSVYIGYNFIGKNKYIALTPLIGGISWGKNFLDVKQTDWSFGLAVTGLQKVPLSLALYKNSKGTGISLAYKFNL
jgi:hypothetical protein